MADQTTNDINRRELTFAGNAINTALPEYFAESYPQLITLFEKYYENLDSDGNFGAKINDLHKSQDIGQTPIENLTLLEDELLLGENYLEGILDTRTGAELSNNYYRVKGTKYGIQRFFRAFFGIDPEVIYGKDLVFNIGDTPIGSNSGKFILNDKVFQYWGLLIKTSISASEWLDLYKLFAHPAGMYIGAEVQIVVVNENISFDCMPISIPADTNPIFETEPSEGQGLGSGSFEITAEVQDSAGEIMQVDPYRSRIGDYNDSSDYIHGLDSDRFSLLAYVDDTYPNIREAMRLNTQTMDMDSDTGYEYLPDIGDTSLTMDRNFSDSSN